MVARRKIVRAGATLAALGATLSIGLVGNSPANADPKQITTALVGYGSETLTPVENAYAGYSLGRYFTPLHAGVNDTQISSWNATGPTGNDNDCFIPKPGAPTIHRPNGSGEGRGMLSAAFGNPLGNATRTGPGNFWGHVSTGVGNPTDPCGVKNVTGLIDYARSSSSVTTPLGSLPFVNVPFARDALAFAYYKPGGGAVTNLSIAELASLWNTGPKIIGGVLIIPCDINQTSGTRGDWISKIGATASNSPDATEACRLADTAGDNTIGQIEENSGDLLTQKGDAVNSGTYTHEDCDGVAGGGTAVSCTGAQVVIGFAASAFVAKGNLQNSLNGSASLGSITGGVAPITGTSPNYVANHDYYYLPQGAANTQMGRNIANVVPVSTLLNSPAGSSLALKAMFRNGTGAWNTDGDGLSEFCETDAQTTAQLFGFLPLENVGAPGNTVLCGDLTLGWGDADLVAVPAVDF